MEKKEKPKKRLDFKISRLKNLPGTMALTYILSAIAGVCVFIGCIVAAVLIDVSSIRSGMLCIGTGLLIYSIKGIFQVATDKIFVITGTTTKIESTVTQKQTLFFSGYGKTEMSLSADGLTIIVPARYDAKKGEYRIWYESSAVSPSGENIIYLSHCHMELLSIIE